MWKWNSVFGVRITFCAHAHTQNTSCPAVVHATHIFRLFFCYLCTFWSYNEQNSMFKKQSLWCQKIENLLPTCLMCRHTTYRMHDRPDRADCERHLCIFFWLMFETSGVHSTWTFPHEMHSPKWGTKDVKNDKHSTLRVPPISGWHSLCKRRGRVNSTC